MEHINLKDLTLIGEGATSKVYRYNKLYGQANMPAVVKVGGYMIAESYRDNIEKLKHAGLMTIAFADPCSVEGKPAVIMYDLNAGNEVWVSPNTVVNGHHSEAEAYLLANRIVDIANFDDLLAMMRDIANCTNGKGIGLDMDMVFFGMQRNESCPSVYYRLVDVDAMQFNPSMAYKLEESNTVAAKEAVTLFVKYFVEPGEKQNELLDRISIYEW